MLITTQQILDEYGITRQTLNNWRKKNIIPTPTHKVGRQNAWTLQQVENIEHVLRENQPRKEQFSSSDTLPLLHIENRRYLGSKHKLLPFIKHITDTYTTDVHSIADVFGGTGVVADMFNKQGKSIIVNDILSSNYISYQTWFSNQLIDEEKVYNRIVELNNLNGTYGYVSETFGNKYFTLENAKKIDAVREQIDLYDDLNQRERAFLLTSLLYAMDKAANTVGHFDAYRKRLDNTNKIYLRMPEYTVNTDNYIFNDDANKIVRNIYPDLVYIDTPYNSRGYENAYHVLENVIEWKKPKVEGVAMKAVDRAAKSSAYTKVHAPQAFFDLIEHINAKYILVSYNNMAHKGNSRSNAKISNEEIVDILATRGKVSIFETDFNPFTAGKSHISDHKELLYLCTIKAY